MGEQKHPVMPVDARTGPTFFDRFATSANDYVSRAWFFALCMLLILIWAPSYFIFGSVDTWQLVINTATTIVTFLLVALLQNTQTRANNALQQKLNAIADALADLMGHLAQGRDAKQLEADIADLKAAVGLEEIERS